MARAKARACGRRRSKLAEAAGSAQAQAFSSARDVTESVYVGRPRECFVLREIWTRHNVRCSLRIVCENVVQLRER